MSATPGSASEPTAGSGGATGLSAAGPSDARAAPDPGRPMRWGATIYAALIVAFVRPSLWLVALAGFLARGGLVLLAVPILVLPTPSGLANVLGGPVASLVFGSPSPELVMLLVGSAVAAVMALVGGTAIGAWAERLVIRGSLEVAADEGLVPANAGEAPLRRGVLPVTLLRLLGLVPLGLALLAAAQPLYLAIYQELILPEELRTPLLLRVLADIPGPLLWLGVAWLLGDAAAALAVRRLLLEGRSVPVAFALGWLGLIRRPWRVVGTALATTGVVLLLVLPGIVGSATGWSRLRALLVEGRDPLPIATGVLLFVAVWAGGLLLAGAAAAIRGAAWTFELVRRPGPSSSPSLAPSRGLPPGV